jgi:glycerol-3-phosphate cytidylyltransferase|tara:strand:+ start:599 stop:1060 length:462 start_codon:yes stop_codon:yes gene_type:complete
MFLDRAKIANELGIPVEEVKIGFTCSTFDLFHAGHIVMLQESKSLCDYLVCGLLTDPTIDRPDTKSKPVQTAFERYVQLSSCRYVDEVIPFSTEQEIIDMVLSIQPDIRIVGEEYRDKDHTGKGLCPVHYNKRRHSFSSTSLRERVQEANEMG